MPRSSPGGLLAAGIGATLFANILAGLSWGVLGAVIASWPALALVGSYELLMTLVRGQAVSAPAPDTATEPAHLNGSGLLPAEAEPFAQELARGGVPGIRRIRDVLHVGQARAQRVQAGLRVLAGDGPA